MNWNELSAQLQLGEVIVTILNPVRTGNDCESYKSGKMMGFKPGTVGDGYRHIKRDGEIVGGHSKQQRWLKKPKVMVVYNTFEIYPHRRVYFDWIDIDNCTFEIKQNEQEETLFP